MDCCDLCQESLALLVKPLEACVRFTDEDSTLDLQLSLDIRSGGDSAVQPIEVSDLASSCIELDLHGERIAIWDQREFHAEDTAILEEADLVLTGVLSESQFLDFCYDLF